MAGKFKWEKFSTVDLNDSFFDSLKADYPEFVDWLTKKQREDKRALVYNDDYGIGAFLYLKRENDNGDDSALIVNGVALPNSPRLKIGTLRLADRIRKQRLGEGAVGVALWYWQSTQYDEVYVTIFEKHTNLIRLFERFGFSCIGKNNRGECIYLKSRKNLDYSDPYKCFPFVAKSFEAAGILPIYEGFHDRLFPYSELAGNASKIAEITAGNGITKVFLATPHTQPVYRIGMPVFVYRIYQGKGQKTYKSVITSYCTICKVDVIKESNSAHVSLMDFLRQVGNKTVYTVAELTDIYNKEKTLVAIELVYNGYFGKGHNVTHKELKDNNLFESYPYEITYNKEEFVKILEMGDANVQNIIID